MTRYLLMKYKLYVRGGSCPVSDLTVHTVDMYKVVLVGCRLTHLLEAVLPTAAIKARVSWDQVSRWRDRTREMWEPRFRWTPARTERAHSSYIVRR
jgi:hypothetical protein